jgi:NAD(P)-dependent dehydrogenase (short-subunit alcohol dehydrogenase family)
MPRTYVVTGTASGIGKATMDLLQRRDEVVIDVDIHRATVVADLSTPTGRADMNREVDRLSGGCIDAILAIAGVAAA